MIFVILCLLFTCRSSEPVFNVDGLTQNFSLEITNKDNNHLQQLVCEGIKTVKELRQDVINFTGIPYNNQDWNGFPGKDFPDDNVISCLAFCS